MRRLGLIAAVILGGMLAPVALVAADPPAPGSSATTTTAATPTATTTTATGTATVQAAAPKPKSVATAASSNSVAMSNFKFGPKTIHITAGDSVSWHNSSDTAHTATGSSFDSGGVDPGSSFTHTFKSPGTYSYVCTFHQAQGMKGTVVVAAASSSGGGSGGSGSAGGGGSSAGSSSGSGSSGGSGGSSGSSGGGSNSNLPSTGLPVAPLAIIGLILLTEGMVLRRING